MSFFTEDFSTYTVGSVPSDPPWKQKGLGSIVVANGLVGKGLRFNSTGGTRHIDGLDDYSSISVYYYFNFPNTGFYNTSIFELLNGDPSGAGVPIQLFRLGFEADGSLSAITPGKLLDNSNLTYGISLYSGKWYFIQANVEFDQRIGVVTCRAKVALDGVTIIDSSGFQDSTQLVSGLFNGRTTVNYFDWNDASTQSLLDQITLTTPIDAFPNYPNPAAGRLARISQGIIEYSELPDDSNVRVSQGIVEYGELPDDSRVRITQMIIEVASFGGTPSGGGAGWKVREI